MPYQSRCVKIRLKPDSLERVREWARTINESRRSEALATLRDESVVVEAAFLDQTTDGDFLVYFMKAESFETARRSVASSNHDIDLYHQRFKQDTWASREGLELLVDLDRLDELTD
jgi:hypothetical protein